MGRSLLIKYYFFFSASLGEKMETRILNLNAVPFTTSLRSFQQWVAWCQVAGSSVSQQHRARDNYSQNKRTVDGLRFPGFLLREHNPVRSRFLGRVNTVEVLGGIPGRKESMREKRALFVINTERSDIECEC